MRIHSFLGVNRSFCESFHLKIFGEALLSAETAKDRPIELDRDDVSTHSFGSGPNERKARPFSRANSVASLSSSTRMERTMSADLAHSIGMEREPSVSSDARVNGKPGANLPRTKSTTTSSQLFRNRQVGFSRTNSSLLSATGNGSVSIIMGKRKTMVVPAGSRIPAERKVSGGEQGCWLDCRLELSSFPFRIRAYGQTSRRRRSSHQRRKSIPLSTASPGTRTNHISIGDSIKASRKPVYCSSAIDTSLSNRGFGYRLPSRDDEAYEFNNAARRPGRLCGGNPSGTGRTTERFSFAIFRRKHVVQPNRVPVGPSRRAYWRNSTKCV